MSKRRKPGDKVWLKPMSGFVGESNKYRAEIQPTPESDRAQCLLCDDPECIEWPNLFTEPNENKDQFPLCHVSECQMLDEPWSPYTYHYEPFRKKMDVQIKKMRLRTLHKGDQIRYFIDDFQEEFFDGNIELLSLEKVSMKIYRSNEIIDLPFAVMGTDIEVYGVTRTTFDLAKLYTTQ